MDRIARQIARLADAIANGADALALNSKLKELEADHKRLKTESDDEVRHHPLIHPNLAKIYRQKVEHLRDALRGQAHGREAFELVRSLIEDVCLVPTGGTLDIQLKGDLAGILAISAGAKTDKSPEVKALQIKLVAGAGFEPTTFRL